MCTVPLHDVGAVGCGDEDVQLKHYVQVVAEVWISFHGLQASADKHNNTKYSIEFKKKENAPQNINK